MPVITAVEPQAHDPERVSIFLDGRFAFGATRLLAAARHLVTGRELSDEEIEALRRDDEVDRAFNAALNFLSYRPRSRREIRDYFRRKGMDTDVVSAVEERLERLGLVDDLAFARFWVENRQAFRPRGTRALKVELRQKGVEGEIIDEALSGIEDEEPAAYDAAMRKMRSYRALDDRDFFTRMVGFLQRRGFAYGVSSAVARRLLAERGGEPPDDAPPEE
jgi:regulatory protein